MSYCNGLKDLLRTLSWLAFCNDERPPLIPKEALTGVRPRHWHLPQFSPRVRLFVSPGRIRSVAHSVTVMRYCTIIHRVKRILRFSIWLRRGHRSRSIIVL